VVLNSGHGVALQELSNLRSFWQELPLTGGARTKEFIEPIVSTDGPYFWLWTL
jgi:hypothetical protein